MTRAIARPIAVLPLVRADDGVWEALVTPVHGSDDVVVREDLDPARAVQATVRVAGVLATLPIFVDDDDHAVVPYEDALPS